MEILAIAAGSVIGSSDAHVIGAARELVLEGIDVAVCDDLEALPRFDTDLADGGTPPPAVQAFRRKVAQADAVLIVSSPAAAHALGNALEWLAPTGELGVKPVGMVSTGAEVDEAAHAHAALAQALDDLGTDLVKGASFRLPVGNPSSPEPAGSLTGSLVVDGMRFCIITLAQAAKA